MSFLNPWKSWKFKLERRLPAKIVHSPFQVEIEISHTKQSDHKIIIIIEKVIFKDIKNEKVTYI